MKPLLDAGERDPGPRVALQNPRGSILIVCFFVLVLLTMFTITVGYTTRQKFQVLSRLDTRQKLRHIGDAGVQKAIYELLKYREHSFSHDALNQGWSFGGQLAFNLNSDDDLGYSNIYNVNPIDFADFNNVVMAGDFYIVNFNTGLDGTAYGSNYNTATQSNQAAIAKQGLAIRNAVTHVLQATGKEKVILANYSGHGLLDLNGYDNFLHNKL